MGNVRAHLNQIGKDYRNYCEFDREERNLSAILYFTILQKDNLNRFLDIIECPFNIVPSEMAIYLEYAYLRDLWTQIKSNEIKRELICSCLDGLLDSDKMVRLKSKQIMSIKDFNEYFGATPAPSLSFIQEPGRWSIEKFIKISPEMNY